MNLSWYWNRLLKMSIPELMWRIQQKALFVVIKNRLSNNKDKLSVLSFSKLSDTRDKISLFKVTNKLSFSMESYKVLSIPIKLDKNTGYPIWNFGYHNENEWEMSFSPDIKLSDREDVGDPRVIWELNRLNLLVQLLASNTVDNRKILDLLIDWQTKNPMYIGINWTSAMEAAIRNINLLIVLLNTEDPDLETKLLEMIQQNYSFVKRHYSKFSSANNHLLVELISNDLVTLVLNGKSNNKKQIEEEFARQTHDDGVNREQAVHYHSFVLEAGLIWLYVMDQLKLEVPYTLRMIFEKMTNYLSVVMTKKGYVPDIGDSDEGKILSFFNDNQYIFTLELAGIVFDKNFLFDKEVKKTYTGEVFNFTTSNYLIKNSEFEVFNSGGKFIWKKNIRNKYVELLLNNGEYSLPPLYAHAHADNLSVYLSIDGTPIFVDGGTYYYNICNDIRNKYRLPDYHSTLFIKGDNFSDITGKFMWKKGIKYFNNVYNGIVKAGLTTTKGNKLSRSVNFQDDKITLEDIVKNDKFIETMIINPELNMARLSDNEIELIYNNQVMCRIYSESSINIEKIWIAKKFTKKEYTTKLTIDNATEKNKIIISF